MKNEDVIMKFNEKLKKIKEQCERKIAELEKLPCNKRTGIREYRQFLKNIKYIEDIWKRILED